MGKKNKKNDSASHAATPSKEYYCRYCDRDLKCKEVYDQHVTGKKHMKAEQAIKEMHAAKCKIFVAGTIKNTEPALAEYFTRFGPIDDIKIGGSGEFAFVKFNSPHSVPKALKQMVHRYKNFNWRTRAFESHVPNPMQNREEKEKKEKQKEKQKNTLIDLVNRGGTIPEQFTILTNHLKLKPNCFATRMAICQELTRVLSIYFKDCNVLQFGSSINGYGMEGCDLDLFLEINNDHRPQPRDSTQDMPIISSPLKSCDVKNLLKNRSAVSQEQIEVLKDIDKVRMMQHIFRINGQSIKDLLLIPSKRCPLIRFTHKASGLKCDLSLNNRKALYNSRLLKLYSQDERVQQLVITIRSWAKVQNLSGLEECGPIFTSYATTWLVLFYLMKRETGVIPFVKDLPTLLKDQGVVEEMVESCKCLHIPTTAQLPPSQNKESVADLLLGFFQYYATEVNWEKNALSTFDCQFIPKSILCLDPAYADCKKGQMMMLDPFVLAHNILGNVSEKVKIRFQLEAKKGAEIVQKWSSSGSQGLGELMKPSKIENSPEFKAVIRKMEQERAQMKGVFTIRLSPDPTLLSSEAFSNMSEKLDMIPNELWCNLTQKMIVNVLETVFYGEMKGVEVACVEQDVKDDQEITKTNENTISEVSCSSSRNDDINSKLNHVNGSSKQETGCVLLTGGVKLTGENRSISDNINDDTEESSASLNRIVDEALKEKINCQTGSVVDSESGISNDLYTGLACASGLTLSKDSDMEQDSSSRESMDSHNISLEKGGSTLSVSFLPSKESEMEQGDIRSSDASKRSAQTVENNGSKRFKPQELSKTSDKHKGKGKLHIAQPKDLMSTSLIPVTPRDVAMDSESRRMSRGAGRGSKDKTLTPKSSTASASSNTKLKASVSNKSPPKTTSPNNKAVPVDMEMAITKIVGEEFKVTQIESYSCIIPKPIWKHRNKIKQSITDASNLNRLELEREISSKVLEKLTAKKEPKKAPVFVDESNVEKDLKTGPSKVLDKLAKLSEQTSKIKFRLISDVDSLGRSEEELASDKELKTNSHNETVEVKSDVKKSTEVLEVEIDPPLKFELRVVHSISPANSQPQIFVIMGTKQDGLFKNFFNTINGTLQQIVHDLSSELGDIKL